MGFIFGLGVLFTMAWYECVAFECAKKKDMQTQRLIASLIACICFSIYFNK